MSNHQSKIDYLEEFCEEFAKTTNCSEDDLAEFINFLGIKDHFDSKNDSFSTSF